MKREDEITIQREMASYYIRKARAEAEKAEVELDTARLVREFVRQAQRAADLPSFKVS